jgi:hypothetical protein
MFFIGLGLLVFVGAGIPLYIQYTRYITYTYTNTLTHALDLVHKRHPRITEGSALAIMDRYWEVMQELADIAEAFDLSYIYYMSRHENYFRFLLSSGDDEYSDIMSFYEDPPEELFTAWDTGSIQITRQPYTDEFGTWMSVFKPVFENNRVVGMWGADYKYDYINYISRNAIIALITSFALSMGIAALFAYKVSSALIAPINEIEEIAE